MGRREGEELTWADVTKFVWEHIKMLTIISPVLTLIMLMLWNTYAQPKVDLTTKNAIAPLEKRISYLEVTQEEQGFYTKQILSILMKTTDTNIIRQVKLETEQYRPRKKE